MKNTQKVYLSGSAMCIAVLIVGMMVAFCGKGSAQKPGKTSAAASGESCVHKAPKSVCFICDPSLRDSKRLWCKEHGRYEDRCFICHPEAQDKSRLYCKEHSLYEDECFLCHPELASRAGDGQGNEKQAADLGQMCTEHGLPEQECGICHPDLLGSLQPGQGLKIRFESAQSAEKAGITTAPPDSAFIKGGISFPGRTAFNENASAIVMARYNGIVTSVKVDLGTAVGKGQVLATISSPELAQVLAEFRSTESEARVKETEYLREKDLYEKKVSSRQELDNAAALFHRARNSSEALRQQLINAGIASENLSLLLERNTVSSEFALRAPIVGVVTQRTAAVGQSVGSETPVMTIVDLSSLWVHISVPSSAAANLAPGGSLGIAFDKNTVYPAKVNWVSPEVDRASGMVQIRAVLKNPKGNLKSGMFCRAFLNNETSGQMLAIAPDALASIDGKDVIFARVEPDLYEVRRVTLEGIIDGKALISQGLRPEDKIVVGGTFVVKSEFLKSRLGAGCVDD